MAAMCPDEAAFLAAIKASLDDDAPRLQFADWLEERGQGERAEFIRVQLHLARITGKDIRVEREVNGRFGNETFTLVCGGEGCLIKPSRSGPSPIGVVHQPGCRWHDLPKRERELLREPSFNLWLFVPWAPKDWTMTLYAKEPAFRVGIREGVQDIRHDLRRGFAETLTCTAADWLREGVADATLAAQPVREVRLTTWPERVRRLSISTNGPDVVTVMVPLAGELVSAEAETEEEAVAVAMRRRWPGITFHLPELRPIRQDLIAEWEAELRRAREPGRVLTL
jgi:uncharacterized protein (TIGR02996 family)